MITPNAITKHIKTYLPIFTDLFTEYMTVSSASVNASNVLTVNSTDHGKSAGDNIVVSAGTFRNPIASAVLVDGTVKFTTTYEHDLIMPSKPLDVDEIELAGFGAPWDGTHDIADVPNRKNIIVNLPSGETLAPVLTGSEYLIEQRTAGLFGVQEVATVPGDDSFTAALYGVHSLPVGTVDDLKIISGFRIAAAADFKRAQAAYTKQTSGDAFLFVIMTDGDVSKDRHTHFDGVAGFTAQDFKLLKILRNFSTVVFIPTGNDLAGSAAQELCYSTIYTALLSVLFGYSDGEGAIQYSAVPTGDGPAEYNTAYYAHTFEWQLPHTLTFEDGFLQYRDVAFRDIAAAFDLMADSAAKMEFNLNLDDDPL